MDIISSRKKQISHLDFFIKGKQEVIDDVLDKLGWSVEGLTEIKCCCPISPGHWLPQSSLSDHQDICKYVEEGYLKEDLKKELPETGFFYEKASNVMHVLIDSTMQVNVLSDRGLLRSDQNMPLPFPQTVDRWTVQLTPEQRLAIYDNVVEIAKAAEKQKNIDLDDLMIDFEKKDNQGNKPKSKLELLAELRDYKRRRQSYRAKNVHITKKSYTEIMKEVIENQMSYLVDTLKPESSQNFREENAPDMPDSQRNNSDYPALKHQEKHSEYTSSKKRHRSREEWSEGHSSQRKKHKKHRSRSKSPSKHKHKSHKHKKSYD